MYAAGISQSGALDYGFPTSFILSQIARARAALLTHGYYRNKFRVRITDTWTLELVKINITIRFFTDFVGFFWKRADNDIFNYEYVS